MRRGAKIPTRFVSIIGEKETLKTTLTDRRKCSTKTLFVQKCATVHQAYTEQELDKIFVKDLRKNF